LLVVLQVVWGVLGTPPARGSGLSLAREAEGHLAAWRFAQAEALLTLLAAAAPDDAAVLRARARLYYLRGDYETAHRLLERMPAAVRAADPRVRKVAAARAVTRGFVTRRDAAGHFEIRHPPGLEGLLVPYALQTLSQVRGVLARDWGLRPDGPVRVEILPGPEALAKLSPLTEQDVRRTGTIALSRERRIMLVTPRALLTGYGWQDTLAHEYVHYVLEVKARGRVPLWLHEGLARYAQERWREPFPKALTPRQAHLLAKALAGGGLVPLTRMVPSFAKLDSAQQAALAYAQVHSMVLYLVERHGQAGLKQILAALSAGADVDAALRRLTGVSLTPFVARWKRALAQQGLEPVQAYEVHGRRYRPARRPGATPAPGVGAAPGAGAAPGVGAAPDPSPQPDTALPRQGVARYRRLGALLRSRGRLMAASKAYRRALAESDHTDGRVANTLARVLLRRGRAAEAQQVIERVLPYNPERAALYVAAARAAQARQKPALAERMLWAANRIDPFDPEIHCRLAPLLAARQDRRAPQERKACQRLETAAAR
jgi:tetratricopeptide (TPR) repeat protein